MSCPHLLEPFSTQLTSAPTCLQELYTSYSLSSYLLVCCLAPEESVVNMAEIIPCLGEGRRAEQHVISKVIHHFSFIKEI